MPTMKEHLAAQDLGLTYEAAGHGVQTAIGLLLGARKNIDPETPVGRELKHQRTGLDLRASDAMGLASLLIDKGLITDEDYREYMRLAANAELRRYEKEAREVLPGVNCR